MAWMSKIQAFRAELFRCPIRIIIFRWKQKSCSKRRLYVKGSLHQTYAIPTNIIRRIRNKNHTTMYHMPTHEDLIICKHMNTITNDYEYLFPFMHLIYYHHYHTTFIYYIINIQTTSINIPTLYLNKHYLLLDIS